MTKSEKTKRRNVSLQILAHGLNMGRSYKCETQKNKNEKKLNYFKFCKHGKRFSLNKFSK